MLATLPLLQAFPFPPIRRARLKTLQVNLGYRCNQQCAHCHVDAGPQRKEEMDHGTAEQVIDYMLTMAAATLDITGGAPELNPNFRFLVQFARAMGIHVIDRCNLTVLNEPGQEDLGQFLAEHQVEIVASLPCYLESNVDQQRGKGVYQRSIAALKQLNRLGYGLADSHLRLNLAYNPQGAALPPRQEALEADYKTRLWRDHGIVFDQLYVLTNMPIKRFGSMLVSTRQFDQYMRLLLQSQQSANLDAVMCRSLLSVDWQGYVYDCDFNQMLGLPLAVEGKPRVHISELAHTKLERNPVATRGHCYACIAGQGSGCGGALG